MISAIAARKAAESQLAARHSQNGSTLIAESESENSEVDVGMDAETSASADMNETGKKEQREGKGKRKVSTQLQDDLQKKRRKRDPSIRSNVKRKNRKPGGIEHERYFRSGLPVQQAGGMDVDDRFKTQEDVIIVGSSSSGSLTSSDSDSDVDTGLVAINRDDPDVSGIRYRPRKSNRKWSPSVPVTSLSASSEDEQLEDDQIYLDDIGLDPPTQPIVPVSDTQLSTFKPKIGENLFKLTTEEVPSLDLPPSSTYSSLPHSNLGSILLLSQSDTCCLLGTCSLTILRGSVELSGVILTASSDCHDIYAPRCSPLPSVRAIPGNGDSVTESMELSDSVRAAIAGHDGVILLMRPLRTGVEGLGNVCRTFDGVFTPLKSTLNKSHSDPPFEVVDGMYIVTRKTKDVQEFELLESWRVALDSVCSVEDEGDGRSVYLIRGPKRSGKSTFARTLLNRLLTKYQRVAFLECDLGQSEFTPAGMVALNVISKPLFGPSFTHPTLPIAAQYIGATTPKSSPSYYLESIQNLIETYQLRIQTEIDPDISDNRIHETTPLIINTMGWSKGLGHDLTNKVQDFAVATDIFIFDRVPATQPLTKIDQHFLDHVPPSVLTVNYSAADYRTLNILSYFHAIFSSPITPSRSWNTSLPLCAMYPYEVDCSKAIDSVVLIGAGSEDVVCEEADRVLNGALVGLLRCEDGALATVEDVPEKHTVDNGFAYIQMHPPPSPTLSNCEGLALVRAVGPPSTTRYLQIVTPLPPQYLSGSRVLVKGEMELPIWGMLDYRTIDKKWEEKDDGIPYLKWGRGREQGVIGGERRRVRRNLMRKSQFT